MKKTCKRILTAVLTCCLLLCLAACGSNGSTASTEAPAKPESTLSRYDYVDGIALQIGNIVITGQG